jgi:hypothetical protein
MLRLARHPGQCVRQVSQAGAATSDTGNLSVGEETLGDAKR